MQRFLGVFSSDHRRLACAVARSWPGFLPPDPDFRGRLGLGTYGGDEVLLMRRPVGHDVQGDAWIGPAMGNHAIFALDDRNPARFSPETTAPWRYRSLVGAFSMGGTASPDFEARLLAMVPDYLVREVRRDPPEALAFRLVLSVLHDMGRLESRTLPVDVLGEALQSVLRLWRQGGDGDAGPSLAACVTDGRCLVAGGTGLPVFAWPADGLPDCVRCSEPGRTKDHDPIRVSHDGLRTVFLAGGDVAPWNEAFQPLPDGAVALVDETGAFRVRSPS